VAIKIGQLVVQLEADVAQLKSGMEEARAEARKTAKELSHQMKDEARGSVQLLGEEIGVRIPRELQKVLAQSSLVGPALSAAFKGVALVAFISLAAEAASKLGDFTDALAGYTTAVQKAEQSEIAFNDSLLLGFKTVKQGEIVLNGLRKTLQDLETQSAKTSVAWFSAFATAGLGDVAGLAADTIGSDKKLDERILKIKELINQVTKSIQTMKDAGASQAAADAVAIQQQQIQAFSNSAKVLQEQWQKMREANLDSVTKIEQDWDTSIAKIQAVLAQYPHLRKLYGDLEVQAERQKNEAILAEERKLQAEIEQLLLETQKAQGELPRFKLAGPASLPSFTGIPGVRPDLEELTKLQRDSNAAIKEANAVFTATRTSAQQYAIELEKLNFLLGKGLIDQRTYSIAVDHLKNQFDALRVAGQALGETMGAIFFDAITQGRSLEDVLKSLLVALIKFIAQWEIMQALQASGGTGFWNSLLKGLFGGFRAMGGPVSPDHAYMVGENGPEMFVPPGSGTIVPNRQLGGGQNIYIDARGADAGVELRVMRAIRASRDQAVAEAVGTIRERSARLV
jgi:hypothetical protein